MLFGNTFAQQAADYFPPNPGYKWNYKLTILDSLNNPIPQFNFFKSDSFAVTSDFMGRNSHYILTKSGTEQTLPFLPYIDTNYVHLSGTDGYTYYKITELEFILSLLDTNTANNLLPFIGILGSFSDWYLNYRFAANINQQYQVAGIDTTINYNNVNIPLRFLFNGRKLADENLQTALGNFLCKKFVISNSINYLIILPPLPPVAVPILTIQDTVWIAPGNWIVQDITPSTNVDLTFAGFENYNIPGLKREVLALPTEISNEENENITFILEQNYPNPFNPSTQIKFSIADRGNVIIKVYDILGKEVVTLLNKDLDLGNYQVTFKGDNLSAGIYFYSLNFSGHNQAHNFSSTKKMLYVK